MDSTANQLWFLSKHEDGSVFGPLPFAQVRRWAAAAQVAPGARNPVAADLALVGAIAIVVTCVRGARVSSALASVVLAGRRTREITGLLAIMVIVSLAPAVALLASVDWDRDGLRALKSVADAAGSEQAPVLVVVIAAVGVDDVGSAAGTAASPADRADAVKQRYELGDVVSVAGRDRERQRQAGGVNEQTVFDAEPTPIDPARARRGGARGDAVR